MFFLYIILFYLLFFFYFFLLPRFFILDGFSFFGMDGLVQYTLRALDTQSFWLFFFRVTSDLLPGKKHTRDSAGKGGFPGQRSSVEARQKHFLIENLDMS